MSLVCPTSRLSEFQMTRVPANLLPFVMDWHRLHSEEGIDLRDDHNALGRSLVSNRW